MLTFDFVMKAKHLKVEFSSTFWAATKATNKRSFKITIESIKAIDTNSKI